MPEALETYAPLLKEEFGDRFMTIWGNFAQLYKLLKKIPGITKVDGILADFGSSQVQLTQKAGFSFYNDTPLDMRMSPAHFRGTAADIVNTGSLELLTQIFSQLGEERFARHIALRIIQDRRTGAIRTTRQLAQLVKKVIPVSKQKKGRHPATKVFQALRIYVNKELDNITSFLPAALRSLTLDGRLVCISFHSLEDRLVKNFFRDQEQLGVVRVLTKKVVMATEQEIAQNPSARSSRLRAVERVNGDMIDN